MGKTIKRIIETRPERARIAMNLMDRARTVFNGMVLLDFYGSHEQFSVHHIELRAYVSVEDIREDGVVQVMHTKGCGLLVKRIWLPEDNLIDHMTEVFKGWYERRKEK